MKEEEFLQKHGEGQGSWSRLSQIDTGQPLYIHKTSVSSHLFELKV